ncbi:MAG: fumarylacetoacetate hydrolase family protein [Proteobacteria bacterium]|nr:fumarylacetoacetate hydrolase family protein [Pseudomonadota bacterium]
MKTIKFNHKSLSPSKIICIGRNYAAHIEELGNEIPDDMVVFLKPNSAISHKLVAFNQEQIHYEAELGFLFEKGRLSAVAFGLDLTKRQLQSTLKNKHLPWERAKAFNGSALFSEFAEIPENIENLTFELSINGLETQVGNIKLMIYKPEQILAEILSFMELYDGDIIMTGTPKGVGIIHQGDVFVGTVLTNNKIITQAEWLAQ